MTREDALARYGPIRASVRRILRSAISACNQSDFTRAAKALGLWDDGKIVVPATPIRCPRRRGLSGCARRLCWGERLSWLRRGRDSRAGRAEELSPNLG